MRELTFMAEELVSPNSFDALHKHFADSAPLDELARRRVDPASIHATGTTAEIYQRQPDSTFRLAALWVLNSKTKTWL
jgi:hypothetical protein